MEKVAEKLAPKTERRRLDLYLVAGVAIAACAMFAGVLSTGIGLAYFLHPTGALIVVGGTLGVTLITTPPSALYNSLGRIRNLFATPVTNREALIDEIVSYARLSRREGKMIFEKIAPSCSNEFLRNALLLALDVKDRAELQSALEMELRLRERQGEVDAKTFEVAGGFAPTIGIIGTVIGLIDVLRQFSNITAVGSGIGTAFVSTIYGLALANLLLLPMAHRIRARVAERFEIHELISEGVLYLVDGSHPSLLRLKLAAFLREASVKKKNDRRNELPLASGANG